MTTTWKDNTKKVSLASCNTLLGALCIPAVVSENVQLNSALEKARGEIRV